MTVTRSFVNKWQRARKEREREREDENRRGGEKKRSEMDDLGRKEERGEGVSSPAAL